jgi:hypothetical protein
MGVACVVFVWRWWLVWCLVSFGLGSELLDSVDESKLAVDRHSYEMTWESSEHNVKVKRRMFIFSSFRS